MLCGTSTEAKDNILLEYMYIIVKYSDKYYQHYVVQAVVLFNTY